MTAAPVRYEQALYRAGVALAIVRIVSPRVSAALRIPPNVLARRAAEAQGAFDAIILNLAGDVCEASSANVFAVIDGEIATPPLSSGCLDGITRAEVLALAREGGFPVAERRLEPSHLAEADEVFLTASVLEVMPAATLDGRPVGAVAPGPVARRLREAYRARAGDTEGRAHARHGY